MTNDSLTRPIIGIENRTAQEVFDIMCDRFRSAEALSTRYRKALEELADPSRVWFAGSSGVVEIARQALERKANV